MPPGSIVNIAGLTPVEDPSYRYKMPLVYGKIEGRGNGIKTVVPNITDVGLSLHRSPAEVNKFFGCELGAQTSYSPETDRAIVNGAHTDAVLQQLVHKYVEMFVLCPNCGLPETKYKIKNESIFHRCAACGAKEMVDMTHRLCTFILAQDKKEKREAKSKEKKDGKVKKSKEDVSDDGDVEKKKKEKKKSKDNEKDNVKKDKDKEKKKKDKKKKDKKTSSEDGSNGSEGKANGDELSVEDGIDDDFAINAAVDETRKFLANNPTASVKQIVEVVINQQMASALKSHDKVHIYIRSVLRPSDITVEFFKAKKLDKISKVIGGITNGNVIMERHLISAVELLCADKVKVFPVMLKDLYESDVLQEDAILEWAAEGRSEFTLEEVDEETRAILRAEAEPLVSWLQDDSDSDSNDE